MVFKVLPVFLFYNQPVVLIPVLQLGGLKPSEDLACIRPPRELRAEVRFEAGPSPFIAQSCSYYPTRIVVYQ